MDKITYLTEHGNRVDKFKRQHGGVVADSEITAFWRADFEIGDAFPPDRLGGGPGAFVVAHIDHEINMMTLTGGHTGLAATSPQETPKMDYTQESLIAELNTRAHADYRAKMAGDEGWTDSNHSQRREEAAQCCVRAAKRAGLTLVADGMPEDSIVLIYATPEGVLVNLCLAVQGSTATLQGFAGIGFNSKTEWHTEREGTT